MLICLPEQSISLTEHLIDSLEQSISSLEQFFDSLSLILSLKPSNQKTLESFE